MSTDKDPIPHIGETRVMKLLVKKGRLHWWQGLYRNAIAQGWIKVFEAKDKSYIEITDKGRAALAIAIEHHKGAWPLSERDV